MSLHIINAAQKNLTSITVDDAGCKSSHCSLP